MKLDHCKPSKSIFNRLFLVNYNFNAHLKATFFAFNFNYIILRIINL